MASGKPGIDLRPGPFLKVAASRLDVSSRHGFPVTLAWVFSGLFFVVFISIAEEAVEPFVLALDRAVPALLSAVSGPLMTRIMWVATLLGDARVAVVATLAAAVVLAAWGHPRRAGSVIILMIVGSSLAEGVKYLIDRPRPEATSLIALPGSTSFPSGHAMAGIVLAGTLALMLIASRAPRWARVSGSAAILATGLLVGVSRVYLGVHFFSDVLGSWCLGATLVGLWAAAVLTWGRAVPLEPSARPLPGSMWWRWALTVVAPLVVVATLVVEAGANPLR